eukprot:6503114-Pyramimonas_sp.AAC.1
MEGSSPMEGGVECILAVIGTGGPVKRSTVVRVEPCCVVRKVPHLERPQRSQRPDPGEVRVEDGAQRLVEQRQHHDEAVQLVPVVSQVRPFLAVEPQRRNLREAPRE